MAINVFSHLNPLSNLQKDAWPLYLCDTKKKHSPFPELSNN